MATYGHVDIQVIHKTRKMLKVEKKSKKLSKARKSNLFTQLGKSSLNEEGVRKVEEKSSEGLILQHLQEWRKAFESFQKSFKEDIENFIKSYKPEHQKILRDFLLDDTLVKTNSAEKIAALIHNLQLQGRLENSQIRIIESYVRQKIRHKKEFSEKRFAVINKIRTNPNDLNQLLNLDPNGFRELLKSPSVSSDDLLTMVNIATDDRLLTIINNDFELAIKFINMSIAVKLSNQAKQLLLNLLQNPKLVIRINLSQLAILAVKNDIKADGLTVTTELRALLSDIRINKEGLTPYTVDTASTKILEARVPAILAKKDEILKSPSENDNIGFIVEATIIVQSPLALCKLLVSGEFYQQFKLLMDVAICQAGPQKQESERMACLTCLRNRILQFSENDLLRIKPVVELVVHYISDMHARSDRKGIGKFAAYLSKKLGLREANLVRVAALEAKEFAQEDQFFIPEFSRLITDVGGSFSRQALTDLTFQHLATETVDDDKTLDILLATYTTKDLLKLVEAYKEKGENNKKIAVKLLCKMLAEIIHAISLITPEYHGLLANAFKNSGIKVADIKLVANLLENTNKEIACAVRFMAMIYVEIDDVDESCTEKFSLLKAVFDSLNQQNLTKIKPQYLAALLAVPEGLKILSNWMSDEIVITKLREFFANQVAIKNIIREIAKYVPNYLLIADFIKIILKVVEKNIFADHLIALDPGEYGIYQVAVLFIRSGADSSREAALMKLAALDVSPTGLIQGLRQAEHLILVNIKNNWLKYIGSSKEGEESGLWKLTKQQKSAFLNHCLQAPAFIRVLNQKEFNMLTEQAAQSGMLAQTYLSARNKLKQNADLFDQGLATFLLHYNVSTANRPIDVMHLRQLTDDLTKQSEPQLLEDLHTIFGRSFDIDGELVASQAVGLSLLKSTINNPKLFAQIAASNNKNVGHVKNVIVAAVKNPTLITSNEFEIALAKTYKSDPVITKPAVSWQQRKKILELLGPQNPFHKENDKSKYQTYEAFKEGVQRDEKRNSGFLQYIYRFGYWIQRHINLFGKKSLTPREYFQAINPVKEHKTLVKRKTTLEPIPKDIFKSATKHSLRHTEELTEQGTKVIRVSHERNQPH